MCLATDRLSDSGYMQSSGVFSVITAVNMIAQGLESIPQCQKTSLSLAGEFKKEKGYEVENECMTKLSQLLNMCISFQNDVLLYSEH